jgi:hypothetical protein
MDRKGLLGALCVLSFWVIVFGVFTMHSLGSFGILHMRVGRFLDWVDSVVCTYLSFVIHFKLRIRRL